MGNRVPRRPFAAYSAADHDPETTITAMDRPERLDTPGGGRIFVPSLQLKGNR